MPKNEPVLVAQLAAQSARGELPAAIFTDLDGTFIVDGTADAAARVFAKAQEADWPIIAITGRDTARLLREIAAGELPPFTALIGAAGTELLLRAGDTYIPEKTYAARLAKQYNKGAIERTAHGLAGTVFTMQEKETPEPFKVSLWFTPATPTAIPQLLEPFRRAMPEQRLVVCEEIYYNAANPDKPKKYNLDILAAHKGDAIRYLMKTYGIKRGIAAGDSGNDIDALLVPELMAVLVGGHRPEAYQALSTAYPGAPVGALHRAGAKHVFIDTHPTRLGPESILLAIDYLRGQAR